MAIVWIENDLGQVVLLESEREYDDNEAQLAHDHFEMLLLMPSKCETIRRGAAQRCL